MKNYTEYKRVLINGKKRILFKYGEKSKKTYIKYKGGYVVYKDYIKKLKGGTLPLPMSLLDKKVTYKNDIWTLKEILVKNMTSIFNLDTKDDSYIRSYNQKVDVLNENIYNSEQAKFIADFETSSNGYKGIYSTFFGIFIPLHLDINNIEKWNREIYNDIEKTFDSVVKINIQRMDVTKIFHSNNKKNLNDELHSCNEYIFITENHLLYIYIENYYQDGTGYSDEDTTDDTRNKNIRYSVIHMGGHIIDLKKIDLKFNFQNAHNSKFEKRYQHYESGHKWELYYDEKKNKIKIEASLDSSLKHKNSSKSRSLFYQLPTDVTHKIFSQANKTEYTSDKMYEIVQKHIDSKK